MSYSKYIVSLFLVAGVVCGSHCQELEHVTTNDFLDFVEATGYVTDAEKIGWSFVQRTVYKYEVVDGANWKFPDGINKAKQDWPVTQISYNDAKAYCIWAKRKLPSYDMYWYLADSDKQFINSNSTSIIPANATNVVGNTWDITETLNGHGEVRLAGGSYLCSPTTCHGTNRNRELYVSHDTGNSNISFVVLVE